MLLVAALLAGCASDVPESEPTRPADALTWATEVDEEIDGLPIAVGSQSRPVDLLLGWIANETLVAAGADVTDDLDLGDTQTTRDAQLAGLIDLYWETTGTGWLALLREIGPSADPEQLYEDVRDEDLEENGIVWLPPAPADTGVGIVASPGVIEDRGIVDLERAGRGAGGPGRRHRGLCLGRRSAARLLRPEPPWPMPPTSASGPAWSTRSPRARSSRSTEEGTFCPFALVDRLNVGLADADLAFLEDDLGAFVAEQPSVTIREDTYDMASGLDDLFAPVAAALDIDTLRDLVARIIEDDEDPRDGGSGVAGRRRPGRGLSRRPRRSGPLAGDGDSVHAVAAIDVVRKYLDAGVSYAQVTREKAEEIVKDLVKAGEVRAEDAQAAVKDLVERSRKSSEALSERIRSEVRDQLVKVQPATQADVDALAKRVAAVERATKKPAARKPAARKPAARKPAARKPAAKKPAAR